MFADPFRSINSFDLNHTLVIDYRIMCIIYFTKKEDNKYASSKFNRKYKDYVYKKILVQEYLKNKEYLRR